MKLQMRAARGSWRDVVEFAAVDHHKVEGAATALAESAVPTSQWRVVTDFGDVRYLQPTSRRWMSLADLQGKAAP